MKTTLYCCIELVRINLIKRKFFLDLEGQNVRMLLHDIKTSFNRGFFIEEEGWCHQNCSGDFVNVPSGKF